MLKVSLELTDASCGRCALTSASDCCQLARVRLQNIQYRCANIVWSCLESGARGTGDVSQRYIVVDSHARARHNKQRLLSLIISIDYNHFNEDTANLPEVRKMWFISKLCFGFFFSSRPCMARFECVQRESHRVALHFHIGLVFFFFLFMWRPGH